MELKSKNIYHLYVKYMKEHLTNCESSGILMFNIKKMDI